MTVVTNVADFMKVGTFFFKLRKVENEMKTSQLYHLLHNYVHLC